EVKEEKPAEKVEEVKKETVQPKEEKPVVEKEKESKPVEPTSDEPIRIETKYKKLEGPNFTGKKLDLSEFEKDKKLAEDRKKTKRRWSKPPCKKTTRRVDRGGSV